MRACATGDSDGSPGNSPQMIRAAKQPPMLQVQALTEVERLTALLEKTIADADLRDRQNAAATESLQAQLQQLADRAGPFNPLRTSADGGVGTRPLKRNQPSSPHKQQDKHTRKLPRTQHITPQQTTLQQIMPQRVPEVVEHKDEVVEQQNMGLTPQVGGIWICSS